MRCGWPGRAPLLLGAVLVTACAAPGPAAGPGPSSSAPSPPAAQQNLFLLLPDAEGRTGKILVANAAGERTLDAPRQATRVRRADSAPEEPRTLRQDEIDRLFGPALAAQPPPPARFVLSFKIDSTELTAESCCEIPRIADTIRERSSVDTSVVGHADTLGDAALNVQLALRRAQAVAVLLEAAGIDPAILEITSHGEKNLLVPTADDVAEPRNRRVEVVVR